MTTQASWRVRLALFAVIYVVGVVALMTVETHTSGTLPLGVALYQSLRFFVVEPWGMPVRGPSIAVSAFWTVMFLAPIVVAQTVLEAWLALYRGVGQRWMLLRGLHDPIIVVAGFDVHGRAVAAAAVRRGFSVVVIDEREVDGGAGWVFVDDRRVPFVKGDFTSRETLLRARLPRARAIWFCSGSPTANLRGAARASQEKPMPGRIREIVPFVDETEDAQLLVDKAGFADLKPMVQFKGATEALVRDDAKVRAAFAKMKDAGNGRIALVGFGRFGRAVMQELVHEASAGLRAQVCVIDRQAGRKVEAWRKGPDAKGATSIQCTAVETEAENWVWEELERPDLVFVCTSDDLANLRLAARLSHGPKATVVLRLFDADIAKAGTSDTVAAISLAGLVEQMVAPRMDAYRT